MNNQRKYIDFISKELDIDKKQANDYLFNKTSFPFINDLFEKELIKKVNADKMEQEARINQRSMF